MTDLFGFIDPQALALIGIVAAAIFARFVFAPLAVALVAGAVVSFAFSLPALVFWPDAEWITVFYWALFALTSSSVLVSRIFPDKQHQKNPG